MKIILALFAAVSAPIMAADFGHAVAVRGCTQEDAPALELYLTKQLYNGRGELGKPYLHIEIAWGDWSKLIERDLELVPLSRHGVQRHLVRVEHVIEDRKPIWLKGTLRLKSVSVGRNVDGSYTFKDDDGNRLEGSFHARWIPGVRTCG